MGKLVAIALVLFAPAAILAQIGASETDSLRVGGVSWATAASGIPKVGLTDGSGNALSSTSGSLNVVGALSNNGATASSNRIGTLPAIAASNMPSAYTAGKDSALATDLHGNLLVSLIPNASFATFSASKNVSPAASATDIAVLPGNGTNTVIVTQVMMGCTQTTAGIQTVQLIKRSSADSGGTSSSMTAVPLDSNDSAAVSAPLVYTANPTTGTAVGNIDTELIGMMAPATATPNDVYFWRPAMGQSIVLRGTAQQLALNLNSTTISGASCDVNFQWIETTGL